jgi:hypothetical protein
VPEAKIATIRPAVAACPADAPAAVAARKRLLYAGDLDQEIGARLVALARATAHSGWSLTIACRPKAEGDAEARAHLQRELAGDLASGRVELLAEVAEHPLGHDDIEVHDRLLDLLPAGDHRRPQLLSRRDRLLAED